MARRRARSLNSRFLRAARGKGEKRVKRLSTQKNRFLKALGISKF